MTDRRPTPARPSLPDAIGYLNPWLVGAAIFATFLGYGARSSASLRLPYDNGPLPGRDWDRGARSDGDGIEGHMEFMRRARAVASFDRRG